MSEILVVDDEPGIREVLSQILEDEGYDVRLAENGAQARTALQEKAPALMLLDIWMPDLDGLSLLKEWASAGPLPMPVIMMSGHGSIKQAVEATRLGAFDFLEKPISLKPLLETIGRALADRDQGGRMPETLQGLGSSETIQVFAHRLRQTAEQDAPLFLACEAGAGAEACARFLHVEGTPWLAPTEFQKLADSPVEWLKEAHGGVLFLEEVAYLTPMQQRGLSLLLGRRNEFNVRVVCASQENLLQRDGFSRELYAQLSRAAVRVPPLREHSEDIPELAQALLAEASGRHGMPPRRFSRAALERLTEQAWPGNLTEFKAAVEALCIQSSQEEIDVTAVDAHLGVKTFTGGGEWDRLFTMPLKEAREQFERVYLQTMLTRCKGSVSRASEMSGLERTHFYRKMRQLDLQG